MKVAFFELENWQRNFLKEKLKRHKLLFFDEPLTVKNYKKVKDVEILGVFVYSQVRKEIIEKLSKLKLICTMSTGYDHIDLEECKKRKIIVCNVPKYAENTVAEHTFALILALSRKLIKASERAKEENFDLRGLTGFDLKDRVIGIIGTGAIGLHVIRMAKGFEMKVIAYDVKKDLKLAKKLGFKYVNFNSLLKNSDIITLHCPLNKYTFHMINRSNIKLMKKGALIINTARGGLIETEALVYGLTNKMLNGVGLDVLEEEFFIKEEAELISKRLKGKYNYKTILENHLLLRHDNVIITPHNAFNSKEALTRILDTTVENINGFLKRRLRNRV